MKYPFKESVGTLAAETFYWNVVTGKRHLNGIWQCECMYECNNVSFNLVQLFVHRERMCFGRNWQIRWSTSDNDSNWPQKNSKKTQKKYANIKVRKASPKITGEGNTTPLELRGGWTIVKWKRSIVGPKGSVSLNTFT